VLNTHAGSRPLKIGLSCTAAVGGRAQQYAAYRRNRRAARFPSIHVCGAELINSACMYLHGALLERRAVRVACCLTTMFLREQHTALLCCGLRRRRRRREPKARRALYIARRWCWGGGGISPISHIMAKKFPGRAHRTHANTHSLALRSHSLTYPLFALPPYTLWRRGAVACSLRAARACHCLRPPVFISARINHAY
jgi:hypothetical protein